MVVVYIASPYQGSEEYNVGKQLEKADQIIKLGACPIWPLCNHFVDMHNPKPRETWLAIDEEKLKRSDIVWRLPGESEGADIEVQVAHANGILVCYTYEQVKQAISIYQDFEESMADFKNT